MRYRGSKIQHRSGSEGPKHDPYHFDEYTVTRFRSRGAPLVVKLHDGLGVWMEVNGVPEARRSKDRAERFFILTGIKLSKLGALHDRIHGMKTKCPKCGSKKLLHYDGYVGEGVQVCSKCGEPVWFGQVTLSMIE